MTPTRPVPVLLDLRASRDVPEGPAGYLELWRVIEPGLLRADPRETRPLRFDRGEQGHVDVRFVAPALNPPVLGADTAFTIVGVQEPPFVRYACGTCRAAGKETYGPFLCHLCGESDGTDERLCDTHVGLLDGAFRTTCPRHEPRCEGCGGSAAFWCDGPSCRRKRAWCERERRRHPGDPSISYCPACFDEFFPRCVTPGCVLTGHLRCEFTPDGGESRCRHRMCPLHTVRWQVYGPSRRGLSLCADHHRRLPGIARAELLRQVVSGTARRVAAARRRRQRGPDLPRLRMIRHIFINVRKEVVDVAALDALFATVRAGLGGSGQDAEAARLIDSSEQARRREVAAAEAEQRVGRDHFARLVALLRQLGRPDLADALGYSEYGGRDPVLWVRVPPHLERQFFGNRATSLRNLGARLGLRVQLERR